MPILPIPGGAPDQENEQKGEHKEDLWSPEYSPEQRAVLATMLEITTAPRPENEQERREDMARILEDSLAHLSFKGIDIPTGINITKDITDAVGWASGTAEKDTPEFLQPKMVERLEALDIGIDDSVRDQLGVVAYIQKVASWRGNDGYGRSPYSETAAARSTVDRIVSTIGAQEGVISADDIIKALSETNIKVGKKHTKSKGKGKNKQTIEISAWDATEPNTQELIAMILSEIARKAGESVKADEEGKPYVLIGEGNIAQPVERNDLGEQGEILDEEDAILIDMMIAELLQNETEESLRSEPSEVGGLILGINENAESYKDLVVSDQETYKHTVSEAARQKFPNAVLVENEEGLFLTVK